MTTLHIHPHAAFDRFPMLVASVQEEFGADGLLSNVERFIDAERADLHWDGRLAEMTLGAYEGFDDEDEAFEAVAIIGYFRGRYYVATCVVDAERRVHWLLRLSHFDGVESAERAFLAGGDCPRRSLREWRRDGVAPIMSGDDSARCMGIALSRGGAGERR